MYNKRRNNNLKLTILTTIILFLLILFLLFICNKLIISIIHTFVYLTGLTTLLLVSIFYIVIILFFIKYIYRHYKCYKRSSISIHELIKLITKFEINLILYLVIFSAMLHILNTFI